MTPNDYQALALRTANLSDGEKRLRLANWCMGLAGESGEVVDYLKKVVFHFHELDQAKVLKELGDVLWYVAVLSKELGFELEHVMEANISKLMARYPEGFSAEASAKRRDV